MKLLLIALTLLLTDVVWAAAPTKHTTQPGEPIDTEIVIRVVAHGAMVVGDAVGGARITITDVATGRLLATGIQTGEAGDQNQIMRTPRLMEEPQYSTRPSGAFRTTLPLDRPTLVEIAAQGPLAYPAAMRRASTTVLLLPGDDLKSDGIVLALYGYIVQIESPPPGQPLMAKDDVKLKASVRTLSGSLVRPHGDWDSRKLEIYGEVLIGEQVIDRLQMFYAGSNSFFEAPFFVPLAADAPNGVTLRVVAADGSGGSFGLGEAHYPVQPERLKSKKYESPFH
jgi:hypothetical protein